VSEALDMVGEGLGVVEEAMRMLREGVDMVERPC
jgi:hypothetical protein